MPTEIKSVALDSIHAPNEITPVEPDDKTSQELAHLDNESKRIELDGRKQDIAARKEYADKIFKLITFWLISMGSIILLAGFGANGGWFKISDSVQIALITTTTGSVLGLFVIVINYLFKNK
jgi:hypothetical protein